MISAAPATCHHTEMLLMIASRWLQKMFSERGQHQDDDELDEDPLRL